MACSSLHLVALLLCISSLTVNAHLASTFYSETCPQLLPIVQQGMKEAIAYETRVGASILRLHFHDCFVNGCDGSILLDDGPNIVSEKMARPNNNSIRGFEVIDDIKAKVEKACPGVVSCADILAIAARDSTVHYGGPSWKVKLGRRDSLTANKSLANIFIPAPTLNLSQLVSNFSAQGLSFQDLVALSGSHTIGLARCSSFRSRIYNDPDIDLNFAKSLQTKCPVKGNDAVLQPFDYKTPFYFDNIYYKNLMAKQGLLHSDQELFNGDSRAESHVKEYATNQAKFFNDFAKSMVRMGNIKPLTGNNGEIRLNCRKPN